MVVHGLRIYPQTVEVAPGEDAPIFIHGRLSESVSDCNYIFRALAPIMTGHIIVNDFSVESRLDGSIIDPIPRLTERFGMTDGASRGHTHVGRHLLAVIHPGTFATSTFWFVPITVMQALRSIMWISTTSIRTRAIESCDLRRSTL